MKTRKIKSVAAQLKYIARDSKKLATMDEKLDVTRFVPTDFPFLNRALVVGGAPLGCIWALHGPYGGGKSSLAVGICKSFIRRGHFAVYIDAEHAVSRRWFGELGLDPEELLFMRPKSFEDTVDEVDRAITNFAEAKAKRQIAQDAAMVMVVDSINKLTPKHEMDQFKKLGAQAAEKGGARFRGLMLQAWLDRLTPIVGDHDIAMLWIAQEREKQTSQPWEIDFKVKGCQGLLFDAMVQIRVTRNSKMWFGAEKKKVLGGYQHRVYVFKNKVGFPNEHGAFYISNGKGDYPIGFVHAKDVLEEALKRGDSIIEQNGAWYTLEEQKFQGEDNVIAAMIDDPALVQRMRTALDQQILEKFGHDDGNEDAD